MNMPMLGAIVLLAITAVSSVVALAVLRPDSDNTGTITVVVALVTTIVTSLLSLLKSAEAVKLAGEVKGTVEAVHIDVNSKMTRLLKIAEELALREGIERGKILGKAEEREQARVIERAKAAGKAEEQKEPHE